MRLRKTSHSESGRVPGRRRQLVAAAGAVCLAAAGLAVAAPASADTAPPPGAPQTPTVSADVLPTVQIDGVVWAQATFGNTVYATGNFNYARPAGAAPGTQTTPRHRILAYDITTGALKTSFAPYLNSQGRAIAVSPDGSRVYVGGDFTSANGQSRTDIAAFDATGNLIATFNPKLNGAVRALYVTNTTVYAGGDFTQANGVGRSRLAAFNASNGALTGFAPTGVNLSVTALQLSPTGKTLVVGGSFSSFGGHSARGLAGADPATGTYKAFAANAVIHDGGTTGTAIGSLHTDGKWVIGTGWAFGGGNFEGAFAADGDTGVIAWMEDCHGDSYSASTQNNVTYVVSHAHYCANLPGGGFPDNTAYTWHRANAYTDYATGKIAHNASHTNVHYADWYGQPGASLLHWYPILNAGTFTGQGQAAWSVTGNSTYIALGGEFPTVNGIAQQGLVRFAVRAAAPNKAGPKGVASLTPVVTSPSAGTVKVSWQATWDYDNQALTYSVTRDGATWSGCPSSATVLSNFWIRPTITCTDTNLKSGSKHSYRVFVADPLNNRTNSATVSVTVK